MESRYLPEDVWGYIKSFALYPDAQWYHIDRTRELLYNHRLQLTVRNFVCQKYRKFRLLMPNDSKARVLQALELMLGMMVT